MANNSTKPIIPDEEDFDEDSIMAEIDDVTKIVTVGAYAIIFLFSLLGNSLVIQIVRTRVTIRRNAFSWLLVNTAVADLLDVITASAFMVSLILCKNAWIPGVLGGILCKLIAYFLPVSICVSVWTLAIIAVDRYLAIVSTVRKRKPLSPKAVRRSIIAVWLFAGLIFTGELYKFRVDEEEGESAVCDHDWGDASEELSSQLYRAEMIVKLVVSYAVPLVVMSVLYSLIARFLWTHKTPGNADLQAHIKRTRKHRAVIKMLVTAVAVFALFWLPVHVAHIMSEFYTDTYNSIPFNIKVLLLYWLAHANAAIHPWLFIFFSENLRKEAKGIFQHLCGGNTNVFDQLRLRTFSLPTLSTTPDAARKDNTTKRDSFIAMNTM